MKKYALLFIINLALLFGVIIGFSSQSYAYNPFEGVQCNGSGSGSAVCSRGSDENNPVAGPGSLIYGITNIVSIIGGAAAIIVILVGSINLITSGGDAEKIKSGRRMITYALVGVAVIVLSQAIITFVIRRLS